MLFSWWNSQTLGTWLHTRLRGVPVGEDDFGNRYYQNKDASRRWVIYNGTVEASRVPPDWHGWLHHTYAEPPTKAPFKTRSFETPHQPNLTGTEGAWRPEGSLQKSGQRPPATGDYQAWEAGLNVPASAMQQNNIAETVIGAIVVAVAAIFLAFTYMRTGSGSLSGYEVNAKLSKVDGLGLGTDVRLSGIKIGSISDLTLDPKTYLVTVHMNIRDDIKIPTDSSLMVTSSGILGSSYLSITPGGDDTMLAAGGMIQNTQSANATDLMSLAGRFIGGGNTTDAPPPKAQTPPAQPANP